MTDSDETVPILGTNAQYGSEIQVEKSAISTEEAVNAAGNSPSVLYIILIVWLFTFNMVTPMAAYFPNFGGYIPYKSWRCVNSSKACFDRTNLYSDSGWVKESVHKKAIDVEYRCVVTIKGFTSQSAPIIYMHQKTGNKSLGEVYFDIRGAQQQIKMVSFTNCKIGETRCQKIFPVNFGSISEQTECGVEFAHSSWGNTSITCNSRTVHLTDTDGIIPVIDKIEQIELFGIDSYKLHCPDRIQYSRAVLCGSEKSSRLRELEINEDFQWVTGGRTSFAVEWNLQCGREYLQTIIGSVFFAGGIFGASLGGILFDIIGRKKGLMIGYLAASVTSFAQVACTSVLSLLVIRFIQGFGAYLICTGMVILSLEYVPIIYRAVASVILQTLWAFGYLLTVLTAYLIEDWHWLSATCGFMYIGAFVPLLLTPESPRFLLVNKNDKQGARSSLKWLISLNKSDFQIDDVILEDTVKEDESKDAMEGIWKYKSLLAQILIQMWLWTVVGFLYFGFSFSWSSFGKNIYSSYLFAAVGEIISYIGTVLSLQFWGRKPSTMLFILTAGLSFLVALVPCELAGGFTVEQLSCLFGSMFVSATFACLYLYSMELAPTSHRGRILGCCHTMCRLGSLAGPQATLLMNWNKQITLAIFAALALSAGLAVFGLPETKGIPTPSTPQEVQMRREKTN